MASSYTTSVTKATGAINSNTQAKVDKYSQDYKESQKVTQAYNQLQNALNSKPGPFQSSYQDTLNDIYGRITNGEKFNFDMNTNVFYNQMKDQYQSLGKLAMQDTMGQAAAMTGGYGSSYAQTAGQQQYQNYMQQLQGQLPSIYQMELERYNAERQDLYNQMSATENLYNNEYNQYRDSVGDWQSDRDYYTGMYQSERDYDYGMYTAERNFWNDQWWKEKNSETTTSSTTVTESGGSGGGGRSSKSSKSSSSSSSASGKYSPLSNAKISEYKSNIDAKSGTAKQKYVDNLLNSGKISQSNWNAFTDYIQQTERAQAPLRSLATGRI